MKLLVIVPVSSLLTATFNIGGTNFSFAQVAPLMKKWELSTIEGDSNARIFVDSPWKIQSVSAGSLAIIDDSDQTEFTQPVISTITGFEAGKIYSMPNTNANARCAGRFLRKVQVTPAIPCVDGSLITPTDSNYIYVCSENAGLIGVTEVLTTVVTTPIPQNIAANVKAKSQRKAARSANFLNQFS